MTNLANSEDSKLVFAIGLPRSGTSLLYALLNQHEQISLMYECDIFLLPFVDFASKFRRNWLLRLEFWNQALSRHGFKVSPDLVRQIEDPTSLYRAYAARKGAALHGEKSPVYAARLLHIARRFPRARYIVIHREFAGIYRSVLDAARHAPYFTKTGTLRRLIYKQEKLIADLERLKAEGVALHRVHYTDLVNRTEEACRAICRFLNIPLDPKMHVLEGADLSAVPPGEHHRQLRGRQVAAREKDASTLTPEIQQLIASFQKRWDRLLGCGNRESSVTDTVNEPSWLAVWRYRTSGALIHGRQLFARTVFEFAPLTWLEFYRIIKIDRKDAAHLSSAEFQPTRTKTLLPFMLSLLWLACVGCVDYLTGQGVTFGLFYIIPSAIMTWHVSVRMGLLTSLISAVAWTVLSLHGMTENFFGIQVTWNIAMRFLQLAFFVALIAEMRVRLLLRDGGSG